MSSMIPQYDTKLMTEIWDEASDFLYDYQNVGIPTTISTQNATTLYYLLYARYGNTPIANYDENQWKYKVFSVIFQYGPTWEKRLSMQETLRGMQLADLIDNGSIREVFESDESGSHSEEFENSGGTTSTGTVTVDTDNDVEDIKNHAYNPGTAPAANAYSPLTYINEQHSNKNVLDGTQETTNDLAGTSSNEGESSGSNSRELDSERNTTISAGKLKAYEKLLELLDSDVTGEFISKFKICFKQFVMPERTWIYVTDVDEDQNPEREVSERSEGDKINVKFRKQRVQKPSRTS